VELELSKPDSPVFSDRTELNTKELDLQALIDIFPRLSLSTQKVLEMSSRGFTHRRRLRLRFLQHFTDLPEEGEIRMLQPCQHS
jgi:hypothetical protein